MSESEKESGFYTKNGKPKYADVHVVDLQGVPRPFSVPWRDFLKEEKKAHPIQIDGSSIHGFQDINTSDLTLLPDPTTAYEDPFVEGTMFVFGNLFLDPEMSKPYEKDSRLVARKAIEYLKSTGIADTAYFGPEAEFYLFDDVKHKVKGHHGVFHVDTREGPWHTHSGIKEGPSGHIAPANYSYSQPAPFDTQRAWRYELADYLETAKIPVEALNAEVGPGQNEVNIKFAPLVEAADRLTVLKHIAKNHGANAGMMATFMAKPLGGFNGSGMHTNMSLFKEGKNVFYDKDAELQLSDTARHFIGGLITHASALAALTNPTVNSYQRLVPGYEAPTILVYSPANRSAGIRIPKNKGEKDARIEARFPDPTANGYLAFSALLMAGLDGIKNRINPGKPVYENLFEGEHDAPIMPGSLREAVRALEKDNDFLLEGNVFTPALLKSYIALQKEEIEAYSGQPHPLDFSHALSR